MTEPPPRRVSIQVWVNPAGNFTAYLPDYDIEVSAPDYDGAHEAAVQAATTAGEKPPMPDLKDQATPRWTCGMCETNNPPERTSCSGCSSPQF